VGEATAGEEEEVVEEEEEEEEREGEGDGGGWGEKEAGEKLGEGVEKARREGPREKRRAKLVIFPPT